MNKATLQTYVRAVLSSSKAQTAEEITYKIQKQFPNEKNITVNRVNIILSQLHYHGLITEKECSTGIKYFSST